MAEQNTQPVTDERPEQVEPPSDEVEVHEDLLVEEVSIDGMCGVY